MTVREIFDLLQDGQVAQFMAQASERLNNFDQFSSKFSSNFSANKPTPINPEGLNHPSNPLNPCSLNKALLERNLITHQGSKKTGGYYAV